MDTDNSLEKVGGVQGERGQWGEKGDIWNTLNNKDFFLSLMINGEKKEGN